MTQTQQISRRTILAGGLGVLSLGGVAMLAGCTPAPAPVPSSPGGVDLGALAFQLAWIRNAQFAGEYVADQKGYFAEGGFSSVDLISGGPNVSVNNVVVGGSALLTLSGCDVTGPAILEGAPLIAIGAVRQKNPLCVMSLADNPIIEPKDLIGKTIGLQAINETTWRAFLAANDMDPADINTVPAQFDPAPLANGEVDGWFSFYANEPNSLRVRGLQVETLLLADFGFPLVSDIIVTRTDSLELDREAVAAAVAAEIRGWRDVYADPALGAQLAVDVYGRDLGLDLEEQTLAVADHLDLIFTDDTRANGLFTITDELVQESLASLARGGIDISAEQLFDLSLLDEVYAANPDLKTAL